ncbi:hypothetical protein FGG08_001288 [Glutinoglossum americanum]|uniref:Uncharacterized protein n=1 Tax=Glutinoglossum americanum TaxID=1670608 RepID=A0A9P8IBX0_9PEZI|nr:hypothetical protein FGG08_001288 [Glutinoglossum americanum]
MERSIYAKGKGKMVTPATPKASSPPTATPTPSPVAGLFTGNQPGWKKRGGARSRARNGKGKKKGEAATTGLEASAWSSQAEDTSAEDISGPSEPTSETTSAEETMPAEGTTSADVTAPAEVITPAEATAPAEVITPAEATAPAEVITPAEATAPAEVITPAEATAPAEVITPAEATTPAEAITPAEGTAPVEGTTPVTDAKGRIPTARKLRKWRRENKQKEEKKRTKGEEGAEEGLEASTESPLTEDISGEGEPGPVEDPEGGKVEEKEPEQKPEGKTERGTDKAPFSLKAEGEFTFNAVWPSASAGSPSHPEPRPYGMGYEFLERFGAKLGPRKGKEPAGSSSASATSSGAATPSPPPFVVMPAHGIQSGSGHFFPSASQSGQAIGQAVGPGADVGGSVSVGFGKGIGHGTSSRAMSTAAADTTADTTATATNTGGTIPVPAQVSTQGEGQTPAPASASAPAPAQVQVPAATAASRVSARPIILPKSLKKRILGLNKKLEDRQLSGEQENNAKQLDGLKARCDNLEQPSAEMADKDREVAQLKEYVRLLQSKIQQVTATAKAESEKNNALIDGLRDRALAREIELGELRDRERERQASKETEDKGKKDVQDQMQRLKASLEEQIRELGVESDSQKELIAQKEQELEENQQKITANAVEKAELLREKALDEREITDLKNLIASADDTVCKHENTIARLKKELDEMRGEVGGTQSQLKDDSITIEDLRSKVSTLKRKIGKDTESPEGSSADGTDKAVLVHEIDRLNKQVESQENELESIKTVGKVLKEGEGKEADPTKKTIRRVNSDGTIPLDILLSREDSLKTFKGKMKAKEPERWGLRNIVTSTSSLLGGGLRLSDDDLVRQYNHDHPDSVFDSAEDAMRFRELAKKGEIDAADKDELHGLMLDQSSMIRQVYEVAMRAGHVEPQAITKDVIIEEPVAVEEPVILEKPAIIERPVSAEKPVVLEKPVIIEKPVVIEKPVFFERERIVVVEKPVLVSHQPAWLYPVQSVTRFYNRFFAGPRVVTRAPATTEEEAQQAAEVVVAKTAIPRAARNVRRVASRLFLIFMAIFFIVMMVEAYGTDPPRNRRPWERRNDPYPWRFVVFLNGGVAPEWAQRFRYWLLNMVDDRVPPF